MACPTIHLCVGAAYFGSVITSRHPTGGSGAWRLTKGIDAGNTLKGVTCTASLQCVVYDGHHNTLIATNPTGGIHAWQRSTLPSENSPLAGLSCSSATACVSADQGWQVSAAA